MRKSRAEYLYKEMRNHVFTIDSTNACKGFSLILLLWHHLFFRLPEYGLLIHNSAKFAKVCVAIFVILSGYGYSECIKRKPIGVFEFYKNRLISIYLNYWLIALIFVPLCSFFADWTLKKAFTSHIYIKFLIQMTGLHRFFYSEHGYCGVWWYLSVIIPLIILFPFIYELTQKYGLCMLCLFLVILLPGMKQFRVINTWLLPFALGIYLSQRQLIPKIIHKIEKYGWWRYLLFSMAIIILSVFRHYSPVLNGTKIDWLIGGILILFIHDLTISFSSIQTWLSFLGEHLFNIFLFHSFIYGLLLKDFIYSFRYPPLIFSTLLIVCIIISITLEYFKKLVFFIKLKQILLAIKLPSKPEIGDSSA